MIETIKKLFKFNASCKKSKKSEGFLNLFGFNSLRLAAPKIFRGIPCLPACRKPNQDTSGLASGSMEGFICKNPKVRKVRFELTAPDADQVALTGDFTDWSTHGLAMKKGLNGRFRTSVRLNSGFYEYKFIVDGEWRMDPANQNTNVNSVNTLNSIMEVEK